MVADAIAEHARGDGLHHAVARKAGDGEPHEEMLERHQLLQIDGQRREVDGIAERAQHGGQIEPPKGQGGGDVEIHQDLIAQECGEAKDEQPRVVEIEHLAPQKREHAAQDRSADGNKM